MLRIAGFWWIAVSAIHGLAGIVFYFEQWRSIAQDGWFNVIAPNLSTPIFDREDAFWFMFLTPILFLLGKLCLWADRQKLTFPISIGGILLATVLVGIFLMPISGLWLLLPPSIMLLQPSKLSDSASILPDAQP
ncbi:MAG: hypothetical protein KME17_27355 [Cyanosarcina radialis HA8281-LM2]|jgi:hypothetical protein|nr:hypothetical protein [Cyanosarcina radialis HA8281-LM2]